MSDGFKVTYTFKQLDKGGLLIDRTKKFSSYIDAVRYVRTLSNTHVGQIVGKPVVERI